jgi:hypothetical protein
MSESKPPELRTMKDHDQVYVNAADLASMALLMYGIDKNNGMFILAQRLIQEIGRP